MENKEKNTFISSTIESPDKAILDPRPKDGELANQLEDLNIGGEDPNPKDAEEEKDLNKQISGSISVEATSLEVKKAAEEVLGEEKETEPVFDGTEAPGLEATRSFSSRSFELDPEAQGSAWPEKAVALKNFVKEKGVVAVSSVLRRLSGKKDEDDQVLPDGEKHNDHPTDIVDGSEYPTTEDKRKEASHRIGEWSTWNPLSFIKIGRDIESHQKTDQSEGVNVDYPVEVPVMKGRIIVYTRLGCKECKEVRLFMHQKRLRYFEINIDIYPSRKLELEKNTGSPAVPQVFFNELLIGGLSDLNALDESGKLADKVNLLINDEPSPAAPMPPLPGEDDVSGSGTIDELASIVRKMKESVVPKDRFYKMRMFSNCFLGSEAVEFLAEDQYLEREEVGRILIKTFIITHFSAKFSHTLKMYV